MSLQSKLSPLTITTTTLSWKTNSVDKTKRRYKTAHNKRFWVSKMIWRLLLKSPLTNCLPSCSNTRPLSLTMKYKIRLPWRFSKNLSLRRRLRNRRTVLNSKKWKSPRAQFTWIVATNPGSKRGLNRTRIKTTLCRPTTSSKKHPWLTKPTLSSKRRRKHTCGTCGRWTRWSATSHQRSMKMN